jgi:hypothetical protein
MDSAEKFPEGFDSMDALMGAATNVILKMTAGLVIDPRSENMQKLKVVNMSNLFNLQLKPASLKQLSALNPCTEWLIIARCYF